MERGTTVAPSVFMCRCRPFKLGGITQETKGRTDRETKKKRRRKRKRKIERERDRENVPQHRKAVARLLGMAWKAPLKAVPSHWSGSVPPHLTQRRLLGSALTNGGFQRCWQQPVSQITPADC